MISWFRKNVHEEEIEKLQSRIINSDAFRYFELENSTTLKEYKKFEALTVGAALYYVKQKRIRTETEISEIYTEVKKIYFRKSDSFLRQYIYPGLLLFDILSKKPREENDTRLTLFVKLNRYIKDIGSSLENQRPYFTEDWPGEYEGEIIENKILYQFISNLFLSEVQVNLNNDQFINTKNDWQIEDEEFLLLEKFAEEFL